MKFLTITNRQGLRKSALLLAVPALASLCWLASGPGSDQKATAVSSVPTHKTEARSHSKPAAQPVAHNPAHGEQGHDCQVCSHPSSVAIREATKNAKPDAIAKHFANVTNDQWWNGVAIGNTEIVPRQAIIAEIGEVLKVKLGDQVALDGRLTQRVTRPDGTRSFGFELMNSGFTLNLFEFHNGNLRGDLVMPGHPVAYRITGEHGSDLVIKRVAVSELLCADWNPEDKKVVGMPRRSAGPSGGFQSVPQLNSSSESTNVLYLDFDGETVTGTRWNSNFNGGNPIVAAATSYSPEEITRIWAIVAEDFRGFNVNVTTDRAKYDAAPIGRRHMNIFTPTDSWFGGAGGVAYLDSFFDGSDDPSWTWNEGVAVGSMTSSHEIGHTFGLIHDGRLSPPEEYYGGTPQWGPIMGAPFDSPIVQWSRGEYPQANNQEDDVAIIAAHAPLLDDDYPDSSFTAFILEQDEAGAVAANGFLTTEDDKDVFAFSINSGDVTFSIQPLGAEETHNINIRARILNEDNIAVQDLNPQESLGAEISTSLPAGTYFLEVSAGTQGTWAAGGFGTYGSIGSYSITGVIPQSGLVGSPGDADGDGLTDDEEIALGSDPYDPDTDGDVIIDRKEVFPYYIVEGSFTYSEAMADARAKGGRLAVIDSPEKLYQVRRGLLENPHPYVVLPANYVPEVELEQRLWIGGTDATTDGLFRWYNDDGTFDGPEIGSAFFGRIVSGSNLITNLVNVNSLTVGRPIVASGIPAGTTITAVNTAARTATLSNPVSNDFNSAVGHVVVVSGGTSYTTPPTVVFDPPGATANAIIDPATGKVTSVLVTNGGSYVDPPDVYFNGGNGGGAIANAILTAPGTASVLSITVTNQGTGYTTPPVVDISGGDAEVNATAVATISAGGVVTITVVNPGSGYNSAPTITLIGDGTGATATATMFVPAGRIYSPADTDTYNNWNTILPGNRNNVPEGLFLFPGTGFEWGVSQVTSGFGYILERPVTDVLDLDTDDDGLSDHQELFNYGTNPLVVDTDGDGLNDYDEIFVHLTDPNNTDSDGDGLSDGDEVLIHGTDPNNRDSDNDGFTDDVEINAVPPSDPLDPTSVPGSGVPNEPLNPLMHNQVELERQQQDVSIPLSFSPFGNRSDFNRFGDDGSAMRLDVNGVLLWQDAAGVIRRLPDSEYAAPLFVSASEAIVWENAFDPARLVETPDAEPSRISLYRIDPTTGEVGAPVTLPIQGDDILPTAPITSTTQPFTLVSFTHLGNPGEVSNSLIAQGTKVFVYRLTFSGQVQLITQINMPNHDDKVQARNATSALGYGTDGSVVFSIDPIAQFAATIVGGELVYDNEPFQDYLVGGGNTFFVGDVVRHRRVFWVNGATVGPAGVAVELSAGTRIDNLGDGGLPPRGLFTSKTRAVYQTFEGGVLMDARRSLQTGALTTDVALALPTGFGQFLRSSPQTREGDIRWIFGINSSSSAVVAYRLVNTGLEEVYRANMPDGFELNADATVTKLNPVDGSAIIDPGERNLMWITNNGTNSAINRVVIPDSDGAKGLYVSRNELVVWANSRDAVDSFGRLTNVKVHHYEQVNGALVNPTGGFTDLSSRLSGGYVLDTVPFTPDFLRWQITTVEKATPTAARFRTYGLVQYIVLDTDTDGLPNLIENSISSSALVFDTDDDGLSDGDEFYPYYIINGNFTWEEAQADAISRGGRLALIKNQDDFTALQWRFRKTGTFNLWLGASDSVTEGLWKWLDGSSLTLAQWRLPSPILNWSAYYSPSPMMPWAASKPDNLNNADGLILRSDFRFEDRPLTERRGYLIEFPRTNAQNRDSDGDGILDSVEIDNGTDPTVADPFSGVPTLSGGSGPLMSFAAPGVAGSYEGLVYDPTQGHVFHQTLTLNNKGSFSSSVTGLTSSVKGSLRGSFNAAGYYIASVSRGLPNIVSIEMEMVEVNPGEWSIRGIMHTSTGQSLGLELRQAKYNKTNPNPLPARFTMALPLSSIDLVGGPQGDGVATGTTDKNGKMTLAVYMPDGGKASYSGLILRGDLLAVRVLASSGYRAAMIGPMEMAPALTDRDIGGFLRYYAPVGRAGSAFPIGFEQHRTVFGSKYVAPARGYLPVTGYTSTAYNALFNLVGGDFGGITKITTWGVDNKISIPKSPTDQGSAKFTTSTGLLTYTYTLTDAERMMNKAKANGVAVVLQKTARITGHYTDSFNGGHFNVTPNDGQIPEITAISPTSKSVSAAAIVYEVRVQTPGQWQIVVPQDATWVTAEITSGGYSEPSTDPAVPSVPSTVIGEGNGVVRITLEQNKTNRRRETRLEIAGINHKIQQEFR